MFSTWQIPTHSLRLSLKSYLLYETFSDLQQFFVFLERNYLISLFVF